MIAAFGGDWPAVSELNVIGSSPALVVLIHEFASPSTALAAGLLSRIA